MNGNAFGFAQGVTGGGEVPPKRVFNAADLRAALTGLKPNGPTVIEIVAGTDPNAFDFGSGSSGPKQSIRIEAKNVTLKPSGAAVLKNFRLVLDCTTADNILITDLAFRSDGAKDGARDAIDIVVERSSGKPAPNKRSRVWITHCSFSGYDDIAIDFDTDSKGPQVLTTIDHCLFYDDKPGLPGAKNTPFIDRGSINLGAHVAPLGNAYVTVANNVYIDVWRRLPRVARQGFGHIYNNLLYRWGYTEQPSDEGSWRGMEVGGGENAPTDGAVDGTVLIQANRFIPWAPKANDDRMLKIHPHTQVDLAGKDPLPNRFDDASGKPMATSPVTVPRDRAVTLRLDKFYTNANDKLVAPTVTAADRVSWSGVLRDAGPRGVAINPGDPRFDLQKFLSAAP